MKTFVVPVTITSEDIRNTLWDHDEAMELILAMDLGIADAGFTEALVRKLCESLEGDMDDKEWHLMCDYIAGLKRLEAKSK